jgi:hypothetical protein
MIVTIPPAVEPLRRSTLVATKGCLRSHLSARELPHSTHATTTEGSNCAAPIALWVVNVRTSPGSHAHVVSQLPTMLVPA